jgi:hypothetical protein
VTQDAATTGEREETCACGPELEPTDVERLTTEAEGGNLSAAATLAVWFANQGDEERSRSWLYFGACRGDCNSLQVLYDELTDSETSSIAQIDDLRRLAASSSCRINDYPP